VPDDDAVDAVLRAARWPGCPDEYALQDAAATLLADAGMSVEREVVLSPRDRVDLLVDGRVAVECKVAGNRESVTRQLRRYAASPVVERLVLLTGRADHRRVPAVLDGVPVTVVFTGAAL